MITDILTKPLQGELFRKLRKELLNIPPSLLPLQKAARSRTMWTQHLPSRIRRPTHTSNIHPGRRPDVTAEDTKTTSLPTAPLHHTLLHHRCPLQPKTDSEDPKTDSEDPKIPSSLLPPSIHSYYPISAHHDEDPKTPSAPSTPLHHFSTAPSSANRNQDSKKTPTETRRARSVDQTQDRSAECRRLTQSGNCLNCILICVTKNLLARF